MLTAPRQRSLLLLRYSLCRNLVATIVVTRLLLLLYPRCYTFRNPVATLTVVQKGNFELTAKLQPKRKG